MQNNIFSYKGGGLSCWMLCMFLLGTAQVLMHLTDNRHVYLLFVFVSFFYFTASFFASNNSSTYKFPEITLFRILLILSIIALARGLIDSGISYKSFMRLYPAPKLFMPYFLVFLSGCSVLSFNYKSFIKLSAISTFIFALLVVFNLQYLMERNIAQTYVLDDEQFDLSEAISCFVAPFVLFLQRDILPKKVWRVALINIVLALFVSLLSARRTATFGIALVFLLGIYKDKSLRWISLVAIAIVGFLMYRFGLLDFMIERFYSDTRSEVNEGFIAAMDTNSWIYGRGATGTYYDANATFWDQTGTRTEIETGFLNMILKGGVIYLLIYVLALGYTAYKGIYKSNNVFVRSFGIIIAISLIELIPYGIPTWNLKYFSIWLGVAICLNPQLRAMTNQEIKVHFRLY